MDSVRRAALIAIGLLAVALGVAGIFLPLLPTTPFLLLAAACFVRSSERLYQWLLNHGLVGHYIRNWREHRAIPMRAKVVTLLLLWASVAWSFLGILQDWRWRALMLLIAAIVTIVVLRVRTLPES